ncbi:MAG: glycosyltransferase family 9 protein, partial [Pseudomonadota bacterium]
DLVLDLHASFRSGLLALANPGGIRIGFAHAKELNTFFQHVKLKTDPHAPHAVDQNMVFADHLGCTPEPADFAVVTGSKERDSARRFLRDSGIGENERFVYANPAARWESKFWTVEAWARFVDLVTARSGCATVFGGSPDDVPYIDCITERTSGRAVTAAGRLGLGESTALLEAAHVYVGVDSGPMHIAAFTGTRVIALFGPTDPAKVGPYGCGQVVVRREALTCLGCRKRSCADRVCLEGLAADQVAEEAVRTLGE